MSHCQRRGLSRTELGRTSRVQNRCLHKSFLILQQTGQDAERGDTVQERCTERERKCCRAKVGKTTLQISRKTSWHDMPSGQRDNTPRSSDTETALEVCNSTGHCKQIQGMLTRFQRFFSAVYVLFIDQEPTAALNPSTSRCQLSQQPEAELSALWSLPTAPSYSKAKSFLRSLHKVTTKCFILTTY